MRGRVFFFHDNPIAGLLFNPSGGFFLGNLPPPIWLGAALPWFLRRPRHFPLAQLSPRRTGILAQIVLAAALLFVVAHFALFRLHFPNRYVYEPLRLVLAMAGGVAWVIWGADVLPRWWQARTRVSGWLPLATLASLAAISAGPALLPQLMIRSQNFVVGTHPRLYGYLRGRPVGTLVATLAPEGDNLPAFTLRSVFVGEEFAYPFHVEYYRKFRERVKTLLEAQYTPDAAALSDFLARSRVDYWLLEADAFTPGYLARQGWLQAITPLPARLEERLGRGESPQLERLASDCETLREGKLRLISALCLGTRLRGGSVTKVPDGRLAL